MGLTFNTYQTFFKISKILHVCIPGGININIKNKRNKTKKLTQHAINRFPTLKCSCHCLGNRVVCGHHWVLVPSLSVVTAHDLNLSLLLTQTGKVGDLNQYRSESKQTKERENKYYIKRNCSIHIHTYKCHK